MFKYLVIVNLLVLTVVTQDMPPPDLELPTEMPTTTPQPTNVTLITTTTTEAISAPPQTENATASTEEITTIAVETTTATATTTTISTEATTKVTEIPITAAPTATTEGNTKAPRPTTDSPISITTTPTVFDPLAPSYLRCYFKKQHGYLQLRWTCQGFKYVYPLECFKCCRFAFSNFAGCYIVPFDHCKNVV